MVERQSNFLGQQRIDLPHLRAMESSVAGDFDILGGQMLGGKQALILKGFSVIVTGAIGAPATNLLVRVADGMLMHYGASEAGSLFWAPADRADEQLVSTNSKVTGSFTASQTNFVGLDLTRTADDTTADNVQFLEPTSDEEISKTVPLARTLDVRFVISTADFSSQSTILPIAKVVTDASNNVVSIQDARQMMFRLGDGGDNPNKFGSYTWPGSRYENTTGDIFTGGDKNIGDMKTWMDAMMTRLWEVGGGEYWYSATADRNVNMIWQGTQFTNGEAFEFVGSNIHWKGLRFLIDNSSGYVNDIADQTGNSAGLTDIAVGECIYVDLDRTKFRVQAWVAATSYVVGDLVLNDTDKAYECTTGGTSAGAGGPTGTGGAINDNGVIWKYVGAGAAKLTAAKGRLITLGSPTVPGSRQILAWRVGPSIYTRGWRYPIGTIFTFATTTSQGMVKISRDYLGADTPGVSGNMDPIALSDRGGTITVPLIGNKGLVIKRFDGGNSILEWQSAGGTLLGKIDNAGDVLFNASFRQVSWPGDVSITSPAANTYNVRLNAALTAFMEFFHQAADHTHFAVAHPAGGIAFLRSNAASVELRTQSATPIDFVTNSVSKWRVAATGELQGQGANRAIQSVLDPVNAQDAATKNYVEQTAISNLIINGDMQIWQRGIGPVDNNVNLTTAFQDRRFLADRWSVLEELSTGAAATDVVEYSQVIVAGEQDFSYAARARYKTNATGTTDGFIWFAQEIDRGYIRKCRGKKLSLTLKWRKGSSMVNDGVIRVITANGDSRQSFVPSGVGNFNNTNYTATSVGSHARTGNYAGTTTILDQTVLNANIGTTMTTQTATTTAIVPVDTTGMVLLIGRKLNNSTADANAYLDLSRVRMVIDTSPPTEFVLSGGTYSNELRLCQQYLEKSTDPYTFTTYGFDPSTPVGSIGMPYNTGGYLGHVNFKVEKFTGVPAGEGAGTIQRIEVFSANSGVVAKSYDVNAAADKTTTVTNNNLYGFQVEATGGTVDNFMRFHYIADYEI
jgi:hypothetical protein